MMRAGDKLTHADGSEWIVAGIGPYGNWALREVDGIVAREFTDSELHNDFDVSDTDRGPSEQDIALEADARKTHEALVSYGRLHARRAPASTQAAFEPPPGSPEAVFAAEADDGEAS